MKELYSFKINKTKEVEVKKETEDGILTKLEKKDVPYKIVLKSPSIAEKSSLEEFQATEWSKMVSSGVLTRQMLSKIYSDNGGIFSKDDVKNYAKLIEDYNSMLLEYQQITQEKGKKAKEDKRSQEITDELVNIYQEIEKINQAREELFRNSAESRSRDKAIQWLVLFLTYVEDDSGKIVPLFPQDDYESKLDELNLLVESEDEFQNKVIEKASLFLSFWFLGKISGKEDFERLEKIAA